MKAFNFGVCAFFSKLNLQATVQKKTKNIFDSYRLDRLISNDRTTVIFRIVMKHTFYGNTTLTTDLYASEYRSSKMVDVGDNQNIQQIRI